MELKLSILLANVALLLTIGLLYDNFSGINNFNTFKKKVLIGLIIGLIGISLMTQPWTYSQGISVDTISILLSISGLFFGLIPTAIVSVITIAFRLYLGGVGATYGSFLIIASAGIGVLANHYFSRNQNKEFSWIYILILSYVTHIVMLFLIFTLPGTIRIQVLESVLFVTLVIYPITEFLLGLVILNKMKRDLKDRLINEREKIFRSLFWHAPIAYQSLSNDFKLLTVNQTWLDTLGFDKEDIVEKSFWDYVHPDDVSLVKNTFNQMILNDKPLEYQLRLIKKNGSYCFSNFSSRIVKGLNNELVRTHCTFIDVTKQVIADREKSTAENAFKKLFDEAPIGIFQTTSKGQVISVNPMVVKILDCENEEELLRHYVSLYEDLYVNSSERERFIELLKRDGKVYQYEYRGKTATGRILWLVMDAKVSFLKENGDFIIEGFVSDITARKEAERELKSIEWMLTGNPDTISMNILYSDLVKLNHDGLILKSVGYDMLTDIVSDYLNLMNTSTAVYELDGSYALGLFTSDWCNLLGDATYKLAKKDSLSEAIDSGDWLCHESCWTNVSKSCIETGQAVDRTCAGGLRLYGEPIYAGDKIVGSLNFGYGSPPKDERILKELADSYNIPYEDILKASENYMSRPPFIVEHAKKQLHSAARIIGEIVERRIVQDELSRSEATLRGLFDNMTSGVAIYKVKNEGKNAEDYYVEYFNKKSLELEGKSLPDVVGKNLRELRPNIDDFGIIPIFHKTFVSGKPIFYPAKVYVDENFNNWYENRVFKIPTGQIVAIYDDVTDKTRALMELKHSEASFRSIFSAALVGIGVIEKRVFKQVNPALCNLLGYTEDELVDKSTRILYLNDEDYHKTGEYLYNYKNGQEIVNYEMSLKKRDGYGIEVLINLAPVEPTELDGEIIFTALDITERKEVEREITLLNQELEQRVKSRTRELSQANKELEAFAYSVAHDLRTPLRAINGFTQFLINDYSQTLDDEGNRLLGIIKNSSHHMDLLIKDLLSLTQIARLGLNYKLVNHVKIIETLMVSNYTGNDISKYEIKIGKLPKAYCDAGLFKHVWSNLLSNAIKYSAPKEHPIIEIGCTEEKDRFVFHVSDNGVGFDMKYVDKLFGVFKRLHRIEDFEGTGVGLAIVKNIISKHNGDVWAKGEVNVGATIYFSIPRKEA